MRIKLNLLGLLLFALPLLAACSGSGTVAENEVRQPSARDPGSTATSTTPAATSEQATTPIGPPEGRETAANLKVALFGDQGSGRDARAVLELIRDEGTDLVIHLGDFDYEDDPAAWDQLISDVLGSAFPYFAAIGNHDEDAWSAYQTLLLSRLQRIEGASCAGDYGINSACTYEGLFFVLSGVGTMGRGHVSYLEETLAANTSTWSICGWHKNQEAMQVGGKDNDVGWRAFEICRQAGAIIGTAHEHSYSRTKTLSDIERQETDPLWPMPSEVRVGGGSTFVFVSGLGGRSIRDQERCLPAEPPYGCKGEWASVYTSNQGATFGALFIEFHIDGDPAKARGYFKNIDGEIIDTFTIFSDPS